jgi:hypothetical protein
MYGLFRLTSVATNMYFFVILIVSSMTFHHDLVAHFFIVLNNVPLSKSTSLSTQQLKDILFPSKMGQLLIKLL